MYVVYGRAPLPLPPTNWMNVFLGNLLILKIPDVTLPISLEYQPHNIPLFPYNDSEVLPLYVLFVLSL